MSIDYTKPRKPLAQPTIDADVDLASLVEQLHTIADEAYGTGCGTGDSYYKGVEDLARWLITGLYPSRKLGDLVRGAQQMQRVRASMPRGMAG